MALIPKFCRGSATKLQLKIGGSSRYQHIRDLLEPVIAKVYGTTIVLELWKHRGEELEFGVELCDDRSWCFLILQ
jgi:hypothetical protein